jgi:hypothetical protein
MKYFIQFEGNEKLFVKLILLFLIAVIILLIGIIIQNIGKPTQLYLDDYQIETLCQED